MARKSFKGTGSVQVQRLSYDQKNIKRWRERRNHIVCELLAKNSTMMREEALKEASRIMNLKSKQED